MIQILCDGVNFNTGMKCTNSRTITDMDELLKEPPLGWISINGTILNNHKDRHLIHSNSMLHFCSKECLSYRLFKNIPELENSVK